MRRRIHVYADRLDMALHVHADSLYKYTDTYIPTGIYIHAFIHTHLHTRIYIHAFISILTGMYMHIQEPVHHASASRAG